MTKSFIGDGNNNSRKIILGRHSLDGRYTELDVILGKINLNIQSAHVGKDLVILIDPGALLKHEVKLVLETILLWNSEGSLNRNKTMLKAVLPGKIVKIFTTEKEVVEDLDIPTKTPYLCFWLNRKIGISTGIKRSISEIESVIKLEKKRMQDRANIYDDLSKIYLAIESSLGWSLVFEPKFHRVISTIDRLNGERNEGRYSLNWNNFFLSYLSGIFSQDIAYVNIIELVHSKAGEGAILKNNRLKKIESIDMPTIPIASVLVKEIYKMHPNIWFLESCFEDLLGWNRWWPRNRLNNGLLSYAQYDITKYINKSKNRVDDINNKSMYLFPTYEEVDFNKKAGTFSLQDVGLNSLYIADCVALHEIAKILNRNKVALELESRIKYFKREMEGLWDKDYGAYLNYNTYSDTLSKRTSLTIFFPLFAQLGDEEQKEAILNKFYNENFFNSKDKMWPALNFLTYLSFRKAGFFKQAKELSFKSNQLLKSGLDKDKHIIQNSFYNSNTLDLVSPLSKIYSFDRELLGIVTLIEKGLIPKPELLIK